jgi:hypothetical protein
MRKRANAVDQIADRGAFSDRNFQSGAAEALGI